MLRPYLLLPLILLLVGAVQAKPAAIVDTLQSPVWLERQQGRVALAIGDELMAGDVLQSGAAARVLLRLADGSQVKLGENTRFELTALEPPVSEGGVLSGALNVLKGAFRFTTGLLGKRYQRDLRVTLNTATIGIRGTDVWGKTEATRDFVVLLEGSIEIERQGQTVHMDDPLTLFMAPKGEVAQPLRAVNMQALAVWAEETEPQAGQGIRQVGGKWVLYLASYREPALAKLQQTRLADNGISSGISSARVNGLDWHRLGLGGFVSREDAEHLASQLRERYGFTRPWVAQAVE